MLIHIGIHSEKNMPVHIIASQEHAETRTHTYLYIPASFSLELPLTFILSASFREAAKQYRISATR